MAASEFLKRRVADGKKEKEEQKKVTASAFLQSRAKGSKETPLSSSGARLTYQKDTYGINRTPKRPASSTSTPSKGSISGAGIFSALPADSTLTGGTINPRPSASLNMPSVAQMKAWVSKKDPNVNINLDKKPIQSHVTVNPTMVTVAKKAVPQRSTAKNRKTMLYETNDSLLSPQELVEKYRYVVEDTEMDANTRNLAAKKGLAATGRLRDQSLFSRELSSEQIQAIAALQGDLTYMTKASARGKGFADAFGLTYISDKLTDNYVNKSGNAQLASEVAKRKSIGAQTAADNPLSGTVGRVLGEGIKYATFSPIIEKQVAKGAMALGKGTLSKGAAFATKLAGHQAADTVLYTPTVVLEGLEANKSKKDIAMDVAKQQALDFGINLGFGAVAAGGRAVKGKRSKASGKNTTAEAHATVAAEAAPATGKERLPEGSEITASDIQQLGLRRNTPELLEAATRERLQTEFRAITDEKMLRQKYSAIIEQYGGNSPQSREFIQRTKARQQELAETLGYADTATRKEETAAISEALKELKTLTNVTGKENTALAKSLLQRAANDVQQYGNISSQTKTEIFQKLLEAGRYADTSMVDKELKATLKQRVFRISAEDASSIADFDQFRKHLFGKVGGVTKNGKGIPVDVAYSELRTLFPAHFPEEITHPAEQLLQIAKVADQQKARKIPLADIMGHEEKAALETQVYNTLTVAEERLKRVVQRQDERRMKQIRKVAARELPMNTAQLSTKDVEGLMKEKYQLGKKAAQAKKKNLLTEWESDKVALLLNQETTMEAVAKAAPSADSLKRITEVYQAESPLRAVDKAITDYRASRLNAKKELVREAVGDIRIAAKGQDGWKDMLPVAMARNTQERIIEKITDKETAKRIKERIFEPIHTAERDRQLFMKGLTDRISRLGIDTKKKYKLTDASGETWEISESGIVQWLGEKRYQLKRLEGKRGISAEDTQMINALRHEVQQAEGVLNESQRKRVDQAIAEFQNIYKEIHPKINKTLIENGYDSVGYIDGYFPHMLFDDATDPVGKALQKLGLDFEAKELPMDIAGRTEHFRPGKKWSGNLLTREGVSTDYDALRAFDQYIDNIGDVIYHTDNIRTLREYEEHIRYMLSPKGIREQADAIRARTDLDWEGMQKELDELYASNKNNHSLQNYVNNIRLYTDILAGKKHNLDRVLEKDIAGRSIYKAVNTLEGRIGANMVAGNIGSALTNVIPITQGMAPMKLGNQLKGLGESMKYMAKGELDDITRASAFLTTREGRPLLYRTGVQKATDIAIKPMELADKFSTQAVWRARYYDNMQKGLTKEMSIREADDYARRLFAGRSKGSMPTIFHSKTAKPLTMFQLEVNNQLDFLLKELPREAHGSAIKAMRIYSSVLLGAYLYNDVYEKLTGRRSALDPIGIANDAVKDFIGVGLRNTVDIIGDAAKGNDIQLTQETEKKKAAVAAGELAKDIGQNVPFVGGVLFDGGRIPISAAYPDIGAISGAVLDASTGDGTWEKAGSVLGKNALNTLLYTAMPFGGGQLRKTAYGLNTMRRGGSYATTNQGERLKFAVDKTNPARWAQAGIFGQWALPEAQDYWNGNKGFNEKHTSTYEQLKEKGIVNMQAYGAIGGVMQAEKPAEKRQALRMATINREGRPIIYYNLLASEVEQEVMDTLKRMKEDEYAVYDCLSRIADYTSDAKKRNVLINAKLSDSSKKYIYRERISKADDARIYRFSREGIDMDSFLKLKRQLDITSKRSLPVADRQEMLVKWLLENGYTDRQRQVIYEEYDIAKKYRK